MTKEHYSVGQSPTDQGVYI